MKTDRQEILHIENKNAGLMQGIIIVRIIIILIIAVSELTYILLSPEFKF